MSSDAIISIANNASAERTICWRELQQSIKTLQTEYMAAERYRLISGDPWIPANSAFRWVVYRKKKTNGLKNYTNEKLCRVASPHHRVAALAAVVLPAPQ